MRNWAHPIELRERAVAAMTDGMSAAEAARIFRVAISVLYDWKRLQRQRGSLAPLAIISRSQGLPPLVNRIVGTLIAFTIGRT